MSALTGRSGRLGEMFHKWFSCRQLQGNWLPFVILFGVEGRGAMVGKWV